MADYSFLQSPTSKSSKSTSYFFNSPRLFSGFSSKGLFETESSIMSPTSILDTKPLYGFKNPLFSETNSHKSKTESEPKRYWEDLDSKKVGLGIVNDLIDEKSHDPNFPNQESRMVTFGSQLRIQIPPMPSSVFYPIESPKLPPDFGTKSRNSKLGSFSPSLSPSSVKKFPFGSSNSGIETVNSNGVFTGYLSGTETEVSEESICVISQVPSSKARGHTFENCIVESCCGIVGFLGSKAENGFVASPSSFHSESFLSYCYTCRKKLDRGKDIFMYRGEKAFCSSECRYQEMLLEEEMEKFE